MRLAILLAFIAQHGYAQLKWPAQAVAESYDVRLISEERATGVVNYASPHFAIASDLKLPLGVVRDLAAVFEATRAAVRAVPLGFDRVDEPRAYRVRLCANAGTYAAAGGATATGGMFTGHELLILLPNIGIQPTTNVLGSEHTRHLFVLKHEVTHQLIAPARVPLPVWLNEGLAECFAATPYVRGRYTFTGLDSALRDYLLKWRRSPDRRALHLIAPPRVMSLSPVEWQREVTGQSAYDLYNSAALLTHWFLHHDDRGDGAHLAAYFDAVAVGTRPDEAEARHLLRGRTREQITAELRALARRMALDATID